MKNTELINNKIVDLIEKQQKLNKPYQKREWLRLQKRIKHLHNKLVDPTKNKYVSFQTIIKNKIIKESNITDKINKMIKNPKTITIQSLITKKNKMNKDFTQFDNSDDICENCCKKMRYIARISKLICISCGKEEDFIDATSSTMTYGHNVGFSNYAYTKEEYFEKWMDSIQAKESQLITLQDLTKIILQFHSKRMSAKDVTLFRIKKILKQLKLSKHNQHIIQIWATITKKKPPRLTESEEFRFKTMFKQIHEIWDDIKPPDRHNFLNYSYILYKFCQLIGRNDFLPFLRIYLHKVPDKIMSEEIIFKKFCDKLGWTFKKIRLF
jgi:hypothetical protein